MNPSRKLSSGLVVEPSACACVLAAIVSGCVLSGCAGLATRTPAPETQVAYKTVDAPVSGRYELREEESSTIPVPTETTPPRYPPTMVAQHLAHVGVRARIIVDTDGKVSEVRIDRPAGEGVHPIEFDDAVRTAATHWRYAPLRIRQWEEVLDREGNVTDSRLVRDDAKPFSLDYEFSFDLRDGKPVVATNTARAK